MEVIIVVVDTQRHTASFEVHETSFCICNASAPAYTTQADWIFIVQKGFKCITNDSSTPYTWVGSSHLRQLTTVHTHTLGCHAAMWQTSSTINWEMVSVSICMWFCLQWIVYVDACILCMCVHVMHLCVHEWVWLCTYMFDVLWV